MPLCLNPILEWYWCRCGDALIVSIVVEYRDVGVFRCVVNVVCLYQCVVISFIETRVEEGRAHDIQEESVGVIVGEKSYKEQIPTQH